MRQYARRCLHVTRNKVIVVFNRVEWITDLFSLIVSVGPVIVVMLSLRVNHFFRYQQAVIREGKTRGCTCQTGQYEDFRVSGTDHFLRSLEVRL